MSSVTIACIVFICVFASGLLGLYLRASLPDHHPERGFDGRGKGSIVLIEEMSRPLEGLMQISSAPALNALSHIAQ